MKTLTELTQEVRELNTEKGWRVKINSAVEYAALLHSEAGEALDAYRIHRLEEYTTADGKPDDVGSELADVFIRLLDTADVLYADLDALFPNGLDSLVDQADSKYSFTEWNALLHLYIARLTEVGFGHYLRFDDVLSRILRTLMCICKGYNIDLLQQYERKMAYNRTRPYQHGGKVL